MHFNRSNKVILFFVMICQNFIMYFYLHTFLDGHYNVIPTAQHIEVGGDAIFLCFSYSNVHWSFDGDDLKPDMITHVYSNDFMYALKIAHVEPKHRGVYTCTGIDRHGKVAFQHWGQLIVTINNSKNTLMRIIIIYAFVRMNIIIYE